MRGRAREEQEGLAHPRRTLLIALPALGYRLAMRLDEADRIVSERIVSRDHLLTRDDRNP